MNKEMKVRGYNVSFSMTDEDRVCCDVSKGEFSASLAALCDEGCLWSRGQGWVLTVPSPVIDEIVEIAVAHGW